jgi:phosphoribosylformimino-5-aminoimidazole carboxamide ribotide isomerase
MTAPFDVYPAIDLRAGRVVRLLRGDYDRQTVYGNDPAAQADAFAAAGARWLHVVDLDAARDGWAANLDAVRAVAARAAGAGVAVQSGGGVRDVGAASALWEAGVTRVVVGTAAVERPDLVRELSAIGAVAVGVDVRGDEVAVKGWTVSGGVTSVDTVRRFEDAGVAAVVVTQIGVDGTLAGPDLALYERLLDATALDVVASGGVGTLDDVRSLAALRRGDRGLAGVVVGRALYDGAFTLQEAMACAPSA